MLKITTLFSCVLLLVLLLVLLVPAPVVTDANFRSDASPVGTAIYAPTATDCPRCIPVGTPESMK